MTIIKYILFALIGICVGLAIIGVFVPGIPTTIFLIFALIFGLAIYFSNKNKMPRKVKWSAIGALIGLIIGFFNTEPTEGLLPLVAGNTGLIIGTMITPMLLGLIGATIVDLFTKK